MGKWSDKAKERRRAEHEAKAMRDASKRYRQKAVLADIVTDLQKAMRETRRLVSIRDRDNNLEERRRIRELYKLVDEAHKLALVEYRLWNTEDKKNE